ncbi:MAG: radical SAM protein [Lachnospiraceae bacterium]|nr:radical SAM protein [Lachnospiraceae bacterium]
MEKCNICPRSCNVDRGLGQLGYCGEGIDMRAALASLHMWEEPPISGTNGSGTIFFSGCNLKCIFCQNFEISNKNKGKSISTDELVSIFFALKKKGAHNINLVSCGHFLTKIREAIIKAKEKGFDLPFLYNTNSYEKLNAIKSLDGLIDIYLPDIKYFDSQYSLKYSGAKDYFEYASLAVLEMYRQTGENKFNENGLLKKGIIIRHLVLPGLRHDSFKILDWMKENLPGSIYISLLNQYTPMYKALDTKELSRRLTTFEYESVVEYFFKLGFKNGYMQKRAAQSSLYTPDFNLDLLI